MSWRATAEIKALRASSGITRTEKLVLMCLADYHNDETGQCNPSSSRLSLDALISERHLIRALAALETKGFIVIRRQRAHEHQLPNQYDLVCLGKQGDTMSLSSARQGDIPAHVRVTFPAEQGDIAMSPKPKPGTVRSEPTGSADRNSRVIPPAESEAAAPSATPTPPPIRLVRRDDLPPAIGSPFIQAAVREQIETEAAREENVLQVLLSLLGRRDLVRVARAACPYPSDQWLSFLPAMLEAAAGHRLPLESLVRRATALAAEARFDDLGVLYKDLCAMRLLGSDVLLLLKEHSKLDLWQWRGAIAAALLAGARAENLGRPFKDLLIEELKRLDGKSRGSGDKVWRRGRDATGSRKTERGQSTERRRLEAPSEAARRAYQLPTPEEVAINSAWAQNGAVIIDFDEPQCREYSPATGRPFHATRCVCAGCQDRRGEPHAENCHCKVCRPVDGHDADFYL